MNQHVQVLQVPVLSGLIESRLNLDLVKNN